MKKFELVEKIVKERRPVDGIDYSILLAYVFGRPIKTEQAFMYFFRRYGLPNIVHDDYKDLCGYLFHTDKKGVVVRWYMNEGDYHYHLYAFADAIDYWKYNWKPMKRYHERLYELAEKDGLVYFGGHAPFTLWRMDESGTKFMGNDRQREAIDKMCGEYPDDCDIDKAWSEVFACMNKNDKEIKEKYSAIAPYPVKEEDRDDARVDFALRHDNQVEAGKKQHEWIMSLRPGHFLRRAYFATMRLFEDWKRPTYIRDQYFNLTCDEDVADFKGKRGTSYTNFWEQLEERAKNV